MKINRLETHDRLEHLKKDQTKAVFEGLEECLKKNQDSIALQEKCPYIYIWAHARTTDNGLHKRMLWQPRLLRPKAQTNSFLFRVISKTDVCEICWIIPERHLWDNYRKGNIAESDIIIWSINMFEKNRAELEKDHPEDLPEHICSEIWRKYIIEKKEQMMIDKVFKTQIHNAEDDFKPYSSSFLA